MKELVIQTIIQNYHNGLDKMDYAVIGTWTVAAQDVITEHCKAFQAQQITVEEYLAPLSDEQLLQVLDSQARMQYC